MSVEDQITKAIGAHGQWKFRLIDAIGKGSSEFDPENVKFDNRCEFGHWLHKGMSAEDRNNRHYTTIVEMHAAFHKIAANILREATTGNTSEAKRLIDRGSEYSDLSTEMTLALMAWKKELSSRIAV